MIRSVSSILPGLVFALTLAACRSTPRDTDPTPAPSPPSHVPPGRPDPTAAKWEIEGKEIDEASGMATSSKHPGVSWVINDGSGGALLFAVAEDGSIRARIPIDGVRTRDAEDLAGFPWRGVPHLLIADVGDNRSTIGTYTLHAVPEPDLGSKSARPTWSLRFRYEDGPHNCEAVAIDPTRAEILIVTKGKSTRLFTLPLGPDPKGKISVAKFAGTVEAGDPEGLSVAGNLRRIATGGAATALDLSPDSRTAALLTYSHVALYKRAEDQSWAEAFSQPPTVLPISDLPQAEALTYAKDAREIWVASERLPAQFARIPVPKP